MLHTGAARAMMPPMTTTITDATPPSLGPNIRRLRRAADMTQEALAARAQIQVSALARIERGVRPVSPDELRRLHRALGLPADRPPPEPR
jgi:transcriptional regulator with XRE-family HTH domain